MQVLEGDGGGFAANWLTPGLVATLLAVLVLVGLVAAFVGWRIYRRVRRSGIVQRGLLVARAQALPPGPGRDIAALRLKLRGSVEGTDRILGEVGYDNPISRLTPLLATLKSTSARVDADLRALEAEPDRVRQSEGLTRYRGEVEKLLVAAAQLRESATSTNAVERGPEVQELAERVNEEVGFLTQYQRSYSDLYRTDAPEATNPANSDRPDA